MGLCNQTWYAWKDLAVQSSSRCTSFFSDSTHWSQESILACCWYELDSSLFSKMLPARVGNKSVRCGHSFWMITSTKQSICVFLKVTKQSRQRHVNWNEVFMVWSRDQPYRTQVLLQYLGTAPVQAMSSRRLHLCSLTPRRRGFIVLFVGDMEIGEIILEVQFIVLFFQPKGFGWSTIYSWNATILPTQE